MKWNDKHSAYEDIKEKNEVTLKIYYCTNKTASDLKRVNIITTNTEYN